MRSQILDTLFQRMAANPDIFFLTADMGINLVEKFQQAYPERYLNVGIAEQNLIGVSAGLANLGYRPFAYTISNFAVHRCYEQIRNDVSLHQYPITILGTSAGYDNAPLGPTHHMLDDWGALKAIPGIAMYGPASIPYAAALVDRLLTADHPAYVRIPKGGFAAPNSTAEAVLQPGTEREILLITYGALAQNCLAVQQADPRVAVLICNCLRPLDEENLAAALSAHRRVIVVEDHFAASGLYGSLCELIVRRRLAVALDSLAPRPGYPLEIGGSAEFFYRQYGLDVAGIRRTLA